MKQTITITVEVPDDCKYLNIATNQGIRAAYEGISKGQRRNTEWLKSPLAQSECKDEDIQVSWSVEGP